MGQAKQRGTREERIAQSMDRQRAAQLQRERLKAEQAAAERERIAAMPEEMQRRAANSLRNRHQAALLAGSLVGALLAVDNPQSPGSIKP